MKDKFNLRSFITEGQLLKENQRQGRETHEGEEFEVWYNIPKGYYIDDGDKIINSDAFFDTYDEAVEHAKIEIEGYKDEEDEEDNDFGDEISRAFSREDLPNELFEEDLDEEEGESQKDEIYRFLGNFEYDDSWYDGEEYDNWDDLFIAWADWMDFYGHTQSDIEGMLRDADVSEETFGYVMDINLVQQLEKVTVNESLSQDQIDYDEGYDEGYKQ